MKSGANKMKKKKFLESIFELFILYDEILENVLSNKF